MTQTDFARGYLATAFPLGTVLLLVSRWSWRRWLHARRRRGELSFRVLLIGSAVAVRELIDSLALRTDAGYRVIAAVVTDDDVVTRIDDVPVYAAADDFSNTLAAANPDTVIVVGSDSSSSRINELSWRLDPGQQLVVAPQLVGVAGSRIHTRPVAGLPLIHVETPSYDGPKRFAKRAFDLVFAGGLLLVLAPLFLVVAVLIKVSSRGPVFYGQERIGLSGEPFTMLKFRSMVTDADAHLADLLTAQGTGGTPLFKVKDDPRITAVGRVLRRYSIDELPQLVNVLKGDMSLVGPRPQRDGEVRLYDSKAGRRLVVKPGMSGLWQVSGRSNLSWEDSIRLDLFYVENWSITNDIIILLRTARAVVGADGAY
jgi:exopolysaccharide biosynthesis polyprenyl glycosylphosphotransferase